MDEKPQPCQPSLSGARYSASAAASREEEKARIQRMGPLERMALALALGRRRRELLTLRAGRPGRHG